MTPKNIGGYCSKREELTDMLINVTKQLQLDKEQQECYKCNGYKYDCSRYNGSNINLGHQS